MTFIDAYGLVALAADEPAAPEVEELLRDGDCRIVAINLAEAVYVCQREHSLVSPEIRNIIEPLFASGSLELAVSEHAETWQAADLRGTHYHRRNCPLSMADCFLLAHAIIASEPIATSDPHVADIAQMEGVAIIALPGRDGTRPG